MRPVGLSILAGLLVSAVLLTGCDDATGPDAAAASGAAASGAEATARTEGDTAGEDTPREPAEIYAQYCVNCHGTGMAGAPMVGPKHRLIWSEEIEEEGFPQLVKIAIEGQNGMPPRGTCFDCSDEEIEATVLYMLKESGAK